MDKKLPDSAKKELSEAHDKYHKALVAYNEDHANEPAVNEYIRASETYLGICKKYGVRMGIQPNGNRGIIRLSKNQIMAFESQINKAQGLLDKLERRKAPAAPKKTVKRTTSSKVIKQTRINAQNSFWRKDGFRKLPR